MSTCGHLYHSHRPAARPGTHLDCYRHPLVLCAICHCLSKTKFIILWLNSGFPQGQNKYWNSHRGGALVFQTCKSRRLQLTLQRFIKCLLFIPYTIFFSCQANKKSFKVVRGFLEPKRVVYKKSRTIFWEVSPFTSSPF